MHNSHDVHLQEREYIKRVNEYLVHHYGKSLDELAIDRKDVANALHSLYHPYDFVDRNAKVWGIKRLPSSIAGSAYRILVP